LGPDRCAIEAIQQTRHQAGDNNQHPCSFGLPCECNNMIGLCAVDRQWKIFALLKQIWLLLP
jgi:hypothetical protein